MSNPGQAVKHDSGSKSPTLRPKEVVSAIIFGTAFGFLLQKGGVGKYHILIGQLLFQDWTVVKIMVTAIVVGMAGIFPLHHYGKINLHLKPTRLGANILGGLAFGAGFGLIGYCPGTAAAALGQGNWDAGVGMVGMIAGSWLFAESSCFLKRTVETWGNLGKKIVGRSIPPAEGNRRRGGRCPAGGRAGASGAFAPRLGEGRP